MATVALSNAQMAHAEVKGQRPPQAAILEMIGASWTSRAVWAFAKLGLADMIHDGRRTAEELARTTDTTEEAMYRLLRALEGAGFVGQSKPGSYYLTPNGATLRSGVPGSMRSVAIIELGGPHQEAWIDVLYALKTGQPSFDKRLGMPVWEYYAKNEAAGRTFDNAMSEYTGVFAPELIEAYDFSRFHTVVDVGGGNGTLMTAMLAAAPGLKGIVFDQPQVVERARAKVTAAGLADRCEFVGGDFFQSLPEADLYTMKWILHDWSDHDCVRILKTIRKAIRPGGRLANMDLIVGPDSPLAPVVDLHMMMVPGGRERTLAEFREIYASAGFRLTRVLPTAMGMNVIEGEPA